MSLFSKIKMIMSPGFDELIRKYMDGSDVGPSEFGLVSDDSAMKFSTLFACFRVLAETFASVPIFEYKKLKNGDREQTDDTGLYDILHCVPNDEMSAYNFKESLMYQICAGGNAICSRLYNSTGGITGLYPIEHQRVQIGRDKDTKVLTYTIDNKDVKTRKDIFHIPGPSVNGIDGMSIIEYASQAVKLGLSYETAGNSFYKNGMLTTGVFEHPTFLKDEAKKRFVDEMQKSYSGLRNFGKPMVLEDGLKFKEVSIKPVDAQFLESKKFQVEEICRFCRVPLHLVQNLDKATNNNIEHQSLEFAMYTMLPHYKRAEEAIINQLLTREQREKGYYFEFNMNALLRGDAKSMADAFAVGRQWGWLSVNDIRRLNNQNGIGPEGDIYLTPLNMIQAGKEPPEPKAPGDKETVIDPKTKEEIENLLKIARG